MLAPGLANTFRPLILGHPHFHRIKMTMEYHSRAIDGQIGYMANGQLEHKVEIVRGFNTNA
jgi:hypothetical protein